MLHSEYSVGHGDADSYTDSSASCSVPRPPAPACTTTLSTSTASATSCSPRTSMLQSAVQRIEGYVRTLEEKVGEKRR
jgi:hypothetical protein